MLTIYFYDGSLSKFEYIYKKKTFNWNGIKWELESVHTVDLAKQMSNTQEVAERRQELELNQSLAGGIKLLCMILTISATSVSFSRSFLH